VLLMAKMTGVPYMIHEQNAIPGLSNRLLGRWAKTICLSFADSGSGFNGSKTLVTGNPLRQGLETVAAKIPAQGKLLIFGGSRGAHAINQAVLKMLPLLRDVNGRPEILHQTGEEDFLQVQQGYRDAGFDPEQVTPFIDDMATAYADASLVICRAGATTLAELAVCGRAAILIYAAGDHQAVNAKALESAGAAISVPQSELVPESLAVLVKNLWADRQTLQSMADQGRKLGFPGAAEQVLNECRRLLGTPSVEAI